jgi:hypothetical protein
MAGFLSGAAPGWFTLALGSSTWLVVSDMFTALDVVLKSLSWQKWRPAFADRHFS